MSCPSAEELSALYDGVVPRDAARALREHLSTCPRCAQEFATLHRLLKVAARPAVPAGLAQRARGLTRSSPPGKSIRPEQRLSRQKPRSLSRR
ncbi:MAG: hypothetical protein GYA21_20255 [Myxococcales bacterium]|nr:hypothetical protein [Myxococcales bacterium]